MDQNSVEWMAPKHTGTDNNLVGNGGDDVTEYLIEWSKKDFNVSEACVGGRGGSSQCYIHSVQRVAVGCGEQRAIPQGTFRLQLDTRPDTTGYEYAAVKIYTSADILVNNASAYDVRIALENMPNIGDVEVTQEHHTAVERTCGASLSCPRSALSRF